MVTTVQNEKWSKKKVFKIKKMVTSGQNKKWTKQKVVKMAIGLKLKVVKMKSDGKLSKWQGV